MTFSVSHLFLNERVMISFTAILSYDLSNFIPYDSASSQTLPYQLVKPRSWKRFCSINKDLTTLETENSRILVKYNITIIAHVTLSGAKLPPPSVMMLLVVAFTPNTILANHNKTLSTASPPALLTPHTSLPQVRMGRTIESNRWNIHWGGRQPIFRSLLRNAKIDFLALSHKCVVLTEHISW